jgi:hypothetical protein
LNVNRSVRGRYVGGRRWWVNVGRTLTERYGPVTTRYWAGMNTVDRNMTRRHRSHRPTNGLVTAHRLYTVLLPSSYRVLTVCHRLYPHGKSFGYAQNFRRVSPGLAGHPTCSPIAQRPTVCPHRVPPFARNLPHGGTR